MRSRRHENDGERVSERSGTTNLSIITIARLRSPFTNQRSVETKRERGPGFVWHNKKHKYEC